MCVPMKFSILNYLAKPLLKCIGSWFDFFNRMLSVGDLPPTVRVKQCGVNEPNCSIALTKLAKFDLPFSFNLILFFFYLV